MQKDIKVEGLAIKLVPKLLGNDTSYSQVFTFIFEAVPICWLVINLVVN